jgi:hypothetical protein
MRRKQCKEGGRKEEEEDEEVLSLLFYFHPVNDETRESFLISVPLVRGPVTSTSLGDRGNIVCVDG